MARQTNNSNSRSKASIARSNRRRGSEGNRIFQLFLQNMFKGKRCWNIHKRSGDQFGGDLVLDSGKSFAFQVKRCKAIPAPIRKALSDDGLALMLDDSGFAIFAIQIDPKEIDNGRNKSS
jgi:hypothetical protein